MLIVSTTCFVLHADSHHLLLTVVLLLSTCLAAFYVICLETTLISYVICVAWLYPVSLSSLAVNTHIQKFIFSLFFVYIFAL